MVGQRFQNFLEAQGLAAEDIPKVAGAVVAAKYGCLVAGVVVGVRYRPLRRLVLARGLVAPRGFLPQQRAAWLREAWEHAKCHHGRTASKVQHAAAGAVVRSQHATRLREAWERVKWHHGRVAAARRGRALPGQGLLLQKQLALSDARQRLFRTWQAWVSKKYWSLALRAEALLAPGSTAAALASRLGIQADSLAMGLAEGTLLAKLAVPITLPLSTLLALRLFRSPVTLQEAEEAER